MAEPVELTWVVQMEMHWDGIFLGRGSGGAAVKEVRVVGRICEDCNKVLLSSGRRSAAR
jgi:hypothetical protein